MYDEHIFLIVIYFWFCFHIFLSILFLHIYTSVGRIKSNKMLIIIIIIAVVCPSGKEGRNEGKRRSRERKRKEEEGKERGKKG